MKACRAARRDAYKAGLHEVEKRKNPPSESQKDFLLGQYEKEAIHLGGDEGLPQIDVAQRSTGTPPPAAKERAVGEKKRRGGAQGEVSQKRAKGRIAISPRSDEPASPGRGGDVLLGHGHLPLSEGSIPEDLVFVPKWTVLERHSFVSKSDGAIELLQEGTLPRDKVRLAELDPEVFMAVASQYSVAAGNCTGEFVRRLREETRLKEEEWAISHSLRVELEKVTAEREASLLRATELESQLKTEKEERERASKFAEEASEQGKRYFELIKRLKAAGRKQSADLKLSVARVADLEAKEEQLLGSSTDACLYSFCQGFAQGNSLPPGSSSDVDALDMEKLAGVLEGKYVVDDNYELSEVPAPAAEDPPRSEGPAQTPRPEVETETAESPVPTADRPSEADV